MAAKTELTFSPLVAQLYDLDAKLDALKAERAAVAKELIAEGDGTYEDAQHRTAVVVTPSKYATKYDLCPPKALALFLEERKAKKATPELLKEFRAAREDEARTIAGEKFAQLFDRHVLFLPTKGFADLVPKLLTTADGKPSAKARDLLLLTQIVTPPKDAYVRLPDKPKADGAAADPDDE